MVVGVDASSSEVFPIISEEIEVGHCNPLLSIANLLRIYVVVAVSGLRYYVILCGFSERKVRSEYLNMGIDS